VELTKAFGDAQYTDALESWTWLDFGGKRPVCSSLFGDVFFDSSDGIWQLDIIDGSLVRRFSDRGELSSAIEGEGQNEILLRWLVDDAEAHGVALAPDEVYDFTTPPVLGGALEVGNLSPMDFVVAVNIAGQIHRQVKDLPPGTPIGKVEINPP
jgi:hypothetical protein